MKKPILFLLLLLLLPAMLSGCQVTNASGEVTEETLEETVEETAETAAEPRSIITYNRISQEEAAEMMENESDFVIVDVRTPEEYSEGHIKGAINVPNETIGNSEIPELPDKDQLLLVYCRTGKRSRSAAAKLAKLGYTNVYEFGGIRSWSGEITEE